MKTQPNVFAIITLAFFTLAASPVAQKRVPAEKNQKIQTDDFSFVRSHRQGKGAVISWAFVSSNAAGFTIQRTYEDPNDPYSVWIDVSSMPCNSSRSYKCSDQNVFPGYINYRVVAVMNDGSTMVSEVTTVRIVRH